MPEVLMCLLVIWAGTALILLIRFAWRYRKSVKKFATYYSREDEQCKRILCRILENKHKKLQVAIKVSREIDIPMGYGIFTKTIILPDETYSDTDIYYILLHECTHFYNHDIWKKIIWQILNCIFWWNPFAPVMKRDFYKAMELKCDLDVTEEMGNDEKAEYLNTILTVLKKTINKGQDTSYYDEEGVFRADSEFEIMERFQMVLKASQNGRSKGLPGILILLFDRRVHSMKNVMKKSMKTSVTLKTLLRSPLKAVLSFFLIAAASFALFSKLTDYVVTSRQTKDAKEFYHCVAGLNNEAARNIFILESIPVGDGSITYGAETEGAELPWPDDNKLREFASLPGVTLSDKRYSTVGMVEKYKRLVDCDDPYRNMPVVFEGTFAGYEDDTDDNVAENHINLKFDNVSVIACEKEIGLGTSLCLKNTPLGDNYFAKSSYTRDFFDNIKVGSRCLVLGNYDGREGNVKFWYDIGEGALAVIDGLSENYLDSAAFAKQKKWVKTIEQGSYDYDITYTSDMRAIPRFNNQSRIITKGRPLVMGDENSCVVSEAFLEAYHLSVGDTIHIKLGKSLDFVGDVGFKVYADCEKEEFTSSKEVTIVGAYHEEGEGMVYQGNDIYLPASLLPVEVPSDYETHDFSVFVEDADDIELFLDAAEPFVDELGLKLEYSDRGWLDVKDSFAMGALTSMLTTILYVLGAVLALYLAVYLYIGRSRHDYAVMRTLGVPGRETGRTIVLPFVSLAMLAMPLGGIFGLIHAQNTARKSLLAMAENAPIGFEPDASIPIEVVIICLLFELAFTSGLAYYFLKRMEMIPPLELLCADGLRTVKKRENVLEIMEQTEPVQFDVARISSVNEPLRGKYNVFRHVSAYILRHMRRSVGKTALSLLLAIALTGGIGMFVLAGLSYQDAFYQYNVKGKAVDFTFSQAVELSQSELVKDFYCYDNFDVYVKNADDVAQMAITSDMNRYLGKEYTIEYAEGRSLEGFESTAQFCLIGKELADKLGIEPGDEIGLLSEQQHQQYLMMKDMDGEDVQKKMAENYKPFEVIGIVNTKEAGMNNTIFAGIKTDMRVLFSSMEFSVSHCEFVLSNNEQLEKLDNYLEQELEQAQVYSPVSSYRLESGGLFHIENVRRLLKELFPIAVTAAALIGMFGSLLVILQSAKEAAFLRVLGVTKKRVRCMLALEQVVLCLTGIVLVAGGLVLSGTNLFARSVQTLSSCFGLYFLACVCGAAAAAIHVTRRKVLELLQVKE